MFYIIPDTRSKQSKRKRGPAVSTVQVKLYHIPGGSEKPIFSKFDNPIVRRHFESGYGKYNFYNFIRPCNNEDDGYTINK